jgi:class 3 adenylate cyclase
MAAPSAEENAEAIKNVMNFAMAVYGSLQGLSTHEKQILAGEKETVDRDVYIGISVGPIVAGIVGVEKFCYDIYGDTVNVGT